jgi:hypothetical protein
LCRSVLLDCICPDTPGYFQCTRIVVQVKSILDGVTSLSPASMPQRRSGWRRPAGRDTRNRRLRIWLRVRPAPGAPGRHVDHAVRPSYHPPVPRPATSSRTLGSGRGNAARAPRQPRRGCRPVPAAPRPRRRTPKNDHSPKLSLVNSSRCVIFLAGKRFLTPWALPGGMVADTSVANAYA